MTTNHHAAINNGAAANAATFNAPLAELDAVVTDHEDRITTIEGASFSVISGNVATLTDDADGVAAGQKRVDVDDSTGFIAGARVAYVLAGTSTVEYNVIDTVTSGTRLDLTTNIGTGGIANNAYITMISESEYQAAQAVEHGNSYEPTLQRAIANASKEVYNVLNFGADATGANDCATAIQAAVDALESAGNGEVWLPAGTYKLASGLTLPDMDAVNNREHPVLRGAGIGQTIINIATPTDITMLTVNGTWRVEGITFKGYESAPNTPVGTAVEVVKMKDAGGFFNCSFNILSIGIFVDDLADGSYMYHCTVSDCWFEALGEAGISIGDASGNSTVVRQCHFENGYLSGAGNAGRGIYCGYNSNVVITGCSFRSQKRAIELVGSQAPIVRDCYFEGNCATAFVETDDTDAGFVPGNYQARDVLLEGNVIAFADGVDATDVFLYARNALGVTLINNWTTAQGAGLIDADTTVKGIVLINNRNDDANTPIFKTATPNGAVSFWQEIDRTTGVPKVYLPLYNYTLPDASGNHGISFWYDVAAPATNPLVVSDYTYLKLGCSIGDGTKITKHWRAIAELNFGEIAAGATAELTIAVAGAVQTDSAFVSPATNGLEAGLMWGGYVSANDTVTVRLANVTSSPINPAALYWNADVYRHA